MFIKYLLDHFIEMQSDKIVNVRLQVSETLALLYEKNEKMEKVEPLSDL